ncbi:MAG: aminotransferase class V-fold PLP-dependent enzyme [Candidatus Thorarchaeota archaeon]
MGLNLDINDFPTCKSVMYFSTASIGLVPALVIDRAAKFLTEISEGGTIALDEEREEGIYETLREKGSKLFKCNPMDIAVFNCVSEALNAIAWSSKIKNGTVVSIGHEFPSVTYPWMRLASERALAVNLIESPDWIITRDQILERIDDKTRLVVFSHVEYLTGQKFNLREIANACHEVGALFIVDGIQAAGTMPLDVEKWDVDAYITGSYKFLCAPFGSAIAYISKRYYEEINPAFVGWRTRENMWKFEPMELTYAPTARKFEYGTSAYVAKLAFGESLGYFLNIGVENIEQHNERLVELLLDELNRMELVEVISPEERGSIVSFKVRSHNLKEINARLQNLERPVELNIREPMLRVSLHLYNSEDDVFTFIKELKQILS